MILNLLEHLSGYDIIVIDDGSEWSEDIDLNFGPDVQYFRKPHGGKEGMWRGWLLGQQVALASKHDYFLFIADDVIPNMDIVDSICRQGWSEKLFSITPTNTGRYNEWGSFRMGQQDFKIDDHLFKEVGFMDLGTLTNRHTLDKVIVDPIPASWFDRPDKSSGVGHMITKKMRALRVCMMTTIPSISTHGDHESVMHKDHRKTTPLTNV